MGNYLSKLKAEWEKQVLQPFLANSGERRSYFESLSRMAIERFCVPNVSDSEEADRTYAEKIGFPGQEPFTRGVYPTMYRGRLWTMRQYAGYASAKESNSRYKYLLQQGQTGLSVAFDLPTQIGYDADHPLAIGEVGKVGVSVCSLADIECLFDGIPLDKVSTSMTINAPAAILLAMYIIMARKNGVQAKMLRGTIQNDILKEYIARGTYIFPPKPSMRLITDIFAYCKDNVPRWNIISISGYHMREAGANAVQEIAFTFVNAIAYVQAALDAGLKVDDFAPQLAFFFVAQSDFFEEIAKFRAARRLWGRIMNERFAARDPRSKMLRFHTQTAGVGLTAQQPMNNIIRVTLQALAAVLGGTQSLHTNSMDEALALPTEESVRVALRTQQIIAEESGVADTIDPLAGSYLLEELTDSLEREATIYLEKIDKIGGALAAIENGFMQKEIQESAYRYQKSLERKERIIVGVNEYVIHEAYRPSTLHVDDDVQAEQIANLKRLRQSRDNNLVEERLAILKREAGGENNLMPPILEAVEAYATIGEICATLREVWGEYQPPFII